MEEIWKDIIGYEGFYSNSRGKFVKMNTAYGFKWKKIEGENKDE